MNVSEVTGPRQSHTASKSRDIHQVTNFVIVTLAESNL